MLKPHHQTLQQQHPASFLFGHQAGFTLLEIVMALLLMGMLTAIAGMGLVLAVENNEFSRTNVHLAQKAQLAMARMSRELMELTAIHEVSGEGVDPYIIYDRMVEGRTPPTVRFGIHHYVEDGTILLYTDLGTDVTVLNSGTADQGDILIDGVNSLTLSFFQGLSEWSYGADIQLLSTINLGISLARPDKPGGFQDFDTTIHLRNTNNFGGASPTTTPVVRGDYSCFIRTLMGNLTS